MEATPESAPAPICKHEFVRIYQRKLKGLDRRLVATKAYLPVGFKMADFGHLSEGSYCFCTKCRARLYPKRTAADRAAARQAAQAKLAAAAAGINQEEDFEDTALFGAEVAELGEYLEEIEEKDESKTTRISVEELDVVTLELEDLGETKAEIPEDEDEDEV
jgi:hypothetical protein